ncbi:MAG: carbohydrate ABC transporter substrate-binding protein, partial [Devosia ginsengisoli]|nr:carbohydrate ABC transporter substrate-binding protein [Devosia ginsengisoli]
MASANTEFWSWAIPANSTQKDLAYDGIRELSGKDATVRAALNGNGPVRPAAYEDPRIIENFPMPPPRRSARGMPRSPFR